MEREIYLQMQQVEDNHWWFVGRRRIVDHFPQKLELPANARVRDAGCGTGENLQFLSRYGKITGIELDEGALEATRSRKVGRMCKGSLTDDMPFNPQTFDLITLFDVLEHVDDEGALLRNLNSLLTSHGYFIITVPAFDFLWSQHDEEHHHRRRYTVPRLTYLMTETGFDLEHISYYNFWLFQMVASIRFLRRFLPPE